MNTSADCQNCGTPLAGRYCSTCGQAADVRIPSFGRVVADAVADLYSFDSRLWRSLRVLVLKPGEMTSRYLEGQRAKYSPPFRMYVLASLVFFVAFSLAGPPGPVVEGAPTVSDAPAEPPTLPVAATAADPEAPTGATVPAAANEEDESFHITSDENGWSCDLDQDVSPALRARLKAACEQIESDSGASFTRAFADNVPVMMLVFIPVVAALMKILYLFARRKYVEHLLFFLHIHTFFFVTTTVTLLLALSARVLPLLEWPVRVVEWAAWIYFPVYLFVAMRHVYRQGYLLTAIKYVLLGGGYFVALLTTLLGTIVYTAVTL